MPGRARAGQRADARRVEILRAAARIFRERGFAGTGMREIAVAAGLSPGNLYHYFRGKDEILFFCQDRSLDRMLAALDAARRMDRPATEQLHRVIVAHALCLLDEVEGSAAHLELHALPPALRGPIVAKRDRYERGCRRLIADGIRRGDLVPCDATVVTRAVLGSLNWTAHWFRPEGPRPAAAVAALVADFLVRGLAARPSSRVRPPARATRPGRTMPSSRPDGPGATSRRRRAAPPPSFSREVPK